MTASAESIQQEFKKDEIPDGLKTIIRTGVIINTLITYVMIII